MTEITITITADAATLARVLDLLGATAESPEPPTVVEEIPAPAPSPFGLPAEPAPVQLSTDEVIARLIAGDRSPEIMARINDPRVSVPEQIAAQKTYPDPEFSGLGMAQ